ncbi:uncharacterized protein LOC123318065 [Coccinella septempunctata]|uniref:uncharacterized protein LOC123318065 n=1 Tax=Coccinella septempunctata TaxID=41139 RepID=UPI001D07841B|nr:uncharacterized protein LOC123318065 [Coccinella septempunctata]
MQGNPNAQPVVIPPLFGNPVRVPPMKDDPERKRINSILGDYAKVKHLFEGNKVLIAPGFNPMYAVQPRAHMPHHPSANRRPLVAAKHPDKNHHPGFPFGPDGRHKCDPCQGHNVRQGNAYKQYANGTHRQIMRHCEAMGCSTHNQIFCAVNPVPDPINQPPSNVEVDRALAEMVMLKAPISPITKIDMNHNGLFFHQPTATQPLIPPAKSFSTLKRNEKPPEKTVHNISGTSVDLRIQLALSDPSDDEEESKLHV